MATSFVLFCSAAIFSLALLDVLLSDNQKKRLDRSVAGLWDRLDRIKNDSFQRIFVTHERSADISFKVFCFVAFSWVASLVILIGTLLMIPPSDPSDGLIYALGWGAYFLISFIVFILLHWVILILTLVFMAIIATTEFIVRRIAEHQKGPIIVTSSLIAASMAFLKTFGG
jgi:hypothetical protein